MRTLRISVAAALALVGALLASVPAHGTDSRGMQSAPPTKVIADCANASYKPHKIVSACGDGNEWAYVKEYGSWGVKVAWGHGRLHLNDCKPSCAEGTMRSYKATFRLHRVVHTHAYGALFTRLGVTYLKGGEEQNAELPLPRRGLSDRGGVEMGGAPTMVIYNCVKAAVEPRKVVTACGDGNEWATVGAYGNWGDRNAWGTGRLHLNDCDPSCAGGTMHAYPARFHFHRAVSTAQGDLFIRLGVKYRSGGETHRVELPLPRRSMASGRGGAAASGAPTMVIYDCVHAKVEPRRVVAACGDQNAWASVRDYGSWGHRNAWGTGRWHANDCVPDCASGSVRSFPARFHLHRMVETGRGDLFTRLEVTYRQNGVRHHANLALPRRPITTG